ncbi:MAG: WYL domain-containing protein [Chloroflexota bacterium]|nr:WYL domain-containing protein [Chloroflexota bacterium]
MGRDLPLHQPVPSSGVSRRHGGDKRSSWLTFKRRLFVVQRLTRGPAGGATLIQAARAALGPDIYPPVFWTALAHDVAALRDEFGCIIRYQHDFYWLDDAGSLALLDVPDDELVALAFLIGAVGVEPLPHAAATERLLARVRRLLPAARQQDLAAVRAQPQFSLPQSVTAVAALVLQTVQRALGRQQIGFAYHSPYGDAAEAETHQVAPYDLLYRDGYLYLDGYCYKSSVPKLARRWVRYRLDRVAAAGVTLLPYPLPPVAPPRPVYRIRYQLSRAAAYRQDVAHWFAQSTVEFQADGTALVSAETADLWQARQILLRYREHCRVLEPPELLALLRESVTRLAQLYAEP